MQLSKSFIKTRVADLFMRKQWTNKEKEELKAYSELLSDRQWNDLFLRYRVYQKVKQRDATDLILTLLPKHLQQAAVKRISQSMGQLEIVDGFEVIGEPVKQEKPVEIEKPAKFELIRVVCERCLSEAYIPASSTTWTCAICGTSQTVIPKP